MTIQPNPVYHILQAVHAGLSERLWIYFRAPMEEVTALPKWQAFHQAMNWMSIWGAMDSRSDRADKEQFFSWEFDIKDHNALVSVLNRALMDLNADWQREQRRSEEQARRASDGSKERRPDSTHAVTYWHIPGGSDYTNARAIAHYFNNEAAAIAFAKKHEAPPAHAMVSKL